MQGDAGEVIAVAQCPVDRSDAAVLWEASGVAVDDLWGRVDQVAADDLVVEDAEDEFAPTGFEVAPFTYARRPDPLYRLTQITVQCAWAEAGVTGSALAMPGTKTANIPSTMTTVAMIRFTMSSLVYSF
jgi:hypothetical protein